MSSKYYAPKYLREVAEAIYQSTIYRNKPIKLLRNVVPSHIKHLRTLTKKVSYDPRKNRIRFEGIGWTIITPDLAVA